MSGNSLGGVFGSGSYVSQIESIRVLDIYEHLKDQNVWPSDSDYASDVRKYVLNRMGVNEDQLNSVQLLDLIENTKKLVKKMKFKWGKVNGNDNFLRKYAPFLQETVDFKIRVRKPRKKKAEKRKKVTVNVARKWVPRKSTKNFADLTDRTKRRQSALIRSMFSRVIQIF